MNTSIYYDLLFANLVGTFLVIMGVTFGLRYQVYAKIFQNAKISDFSVIVTGIFFLWIGLNLLQNHNKWSFTPALAFTILSWLMLISSILMILKPDLLRTIFFFLTKGKMLLLLNILFIIFGFFIIVDASKMTFDLQKAEHVYHQEFD
jgi:hypothetical protein